MQGWGTFLQGAGNFVIACITIYNLYVSRERAKAIALLEQNTNSIKDALIKVTGEAERAKGVLEGQASARPGALPPLT